MKLNTHHYMKIIAVIALILILVVGMALAELEGAAIAFGVCAFVTLIAILCYY